MFSFKFGKTLPYLLGGVFVFFLLRKKNSEIIKKINTASRTEKVKYLTMSESEKLQFCKSKAKLFKTLLGGFPDRDAIIAFYNSYNFCLLGIAEHFSDYWFFGKMSFETRQLFLGLNSSKFVYVDEYVTYLEANEL